MSRNDDIKDNEFRVIGKGADTGTDSGEGRKPWRRWIIVAAAAIFVAGIAVFYYYRQSLKLLLVHPLIATDGVPADAQLHRNLHLTEGLSG